jgi:glucose/arabinose dehydrogenase
VIRTLPRLRHPRHVGFLPGIPLAAGLLLALGAGPAAGVAIPSGLYDHFVLAGLDEPTSMAFTPDGRLFVIEQRSAQVRLLVNGIVSATDPVLVVPEVDGVEYEEGLLGIAVDAEWPARPFIYVHYNHGPTSTIHISRFRLAGDLDGTGSGDLTCDPASRYDVLADIPDASTTHNGGTLRFGPDGMLYASLGEDTSPCAAQDTASFRGKILRLDVSQLPDGPGGPAPKALLVPPGNPYSGPTVDSQLMWANGLRNPFRFHIDPADGSLFIADVGLSLYEEVNRAPVGGLDFGWPLREGPGAGPIAFCSEGGSAVTLTDPIVWYDRSGFTAAVVSGGVYRSPCASCPERLPADYEGDYFYAEYYEGFVRRVRFDGQQWVPAPPAPGQPNTLDWATGIHNPTDFLVGPDGSLWYLEQFDGGFHPRSGSLHRIASVPPPTGVSPGGAGPSRIELEPAYPNPARGQVRFALRLAGAGAVSVAIRDLAGRSVRVLHEAGVWGVGRRTLEWDGRDDHGREVPSGLYLVEARSGDFRAQARVAIVR